MKPLSRAARFIAAFLIGLFLLAFAVLCVGVLKQHTAEETREVPPPMVTGPADISPPVIAEPAPEPPPEPEPPAQPPSPDLVDVPARVPPEQAARKGYIAILIDDIGPNAAVSRRTLDLPPAVSLAILPDAGEDDALAAAARAQGREVIIHAPMEAASSRIDLGPYGLRLESGADDLKSNLNKMFQAFDGYRGMNNHMGSLLTQDRAAMETVMQALKERGLFFVDSRTIAASVAAEAARAAGIPYASRDVFLDHEETPDFTRAALRKTEEIAARNGTAIAIGHPKPVTLAVLAEWIPEAQKRGFVLIPISDALTYPAPAALAPPSPEATAAPLP